MSFNSDLKKIVKEDVSLFVEDLNITGLLSNLFSDIHEEFYANIAIDSWELSGLTKKLKKQLNLNVKEIFFKYLTENKKSILKEIEEKLETLTSESGYEEEAEELTNYKQFINNL